ncbi:MAG: TlpA family protein disulfide reductase [Desulfobacterales bacterium]|nr:MAG: TlpA family protein disulfide reductase [Desulfobacterales bacterium]
MKVIFVFVVFASLASPAAAGVTIERIEESALDDLIQANDNRLVITFMAAWCGPCIDELPILNNLYLKYNEKGLKLIGVSIDLEGPKAMQPIVDKLKINFPIYWYGEKAVYKFKLNAIPMLFFVKHGEIVEKLYGRRSKRILDKKIKEFLK